MNSSQLLSMIMPNPTKLHGCSPLRAVMQQYVQSVIFKVAFEFSPYLHFCHLKKKSCVFLTMKHSCLFSNYVLVDSQFLPRLFTVLIWDAIMLQYNLSFFHNLLLLLFTSFFIFLYLISKKVRPSLFCLKFMAAPLLDVASLELVAAL